MGRGNRGRRNGVEKPSLAKRAAAARQQAVSPEAPVDPEPPRLASHPLIAVVLAEARERRVARTP